MTSATEIICAEFPPCNLIIYYINHNDVVAFIDRFVNWSSFFNVFAILTWISGVYQKKKSMVDSYELVKYLTFDLKQSCSRFDRCCTMLILDTIINNISGIYINKLSQFPK